MRIWCTARAIGASLLLACCTKEPAPPPKVHADATAPAPAPAVCADAASVRASFGRECLVVGTYRVDGIPLKGDTSVDWPVVVLDDRSRVMLESLWDPSKLPDLGTLARLRGKRVEVVGTLHSAPPSPSPENFAFPCLSPVRSLRVLSPGEGDR